MSIVATGGVEHPFVYFSVPDLPEAGAMVECGPDGNVVVLGEFLLRQKTTSDGGFPYYMTVTNGSWLILEPEMSSSAELHVQIAVGGFTK
jgi:hypothetical protein